MQKFIVAVILGILFIFFVITAVRAWKDRATKQEADFSQPPMALTDAGSQLLKVKAFYVATTYADNHLERIRAYGLGIRGLAHVLVFEGGVQLIRKGERPLAISKQSIELISTTQVTIDRVTESKGILTIDWVQDKTKFSTHLRVVDQNDRVKLIAALESISDREAK
jgi:predicted transporter